MKTMSIANKVYITLIFMLMAGFAIFLLILDPVLFAKSLSGVAILTAIIFVFYLIVGKKTEERQQKISKLCMVGGYVLLFVFLAIFFIAGAHYNHIGIGEFLKLWF